MLRWTAYCWGSFHPAAVATSRLSHEKPASPGPYQHLAEEFQRRLADLREAGTVSDPRELQITRLKDENAKLRERVQERDARITELTEFKERALSQLAAQHEEILRLRQRDSPNNVRTLPTTRKSRITGPCS
ncbi:hypothetical protein [Crossiella sp. NPDC003009]